MIGHCKCAFVDSNEEFVPGEACQVHPARVPERTPVQMIRRLERALTQKSGQIDRLQNTVQQSQERTREHAR